MGTLERRYEVYKQLLLEEHLRRAEEALDEIGTVAHGYLMKDDRVGLSKIIDRFNDWDRSRR